MPKEYFDSVLVTGIGLITATGTGGMDLAVLQRRKILENNQITLPGEDSGRITDFDKEGLIGQRGLRHHTRGTLYLMAAARLAMEEAGIFNQEATETIGIITGTMTCNAALVADFDQTTLTEKPTVVNASKFPETVWNAPSSRAAIRFGLKGMNIPVCSGANSGLDAIVAAHEHIRNGAEKIILAGGFEEMTPYFSVLFAEQTVLPLREGSAILVLEQEDFARARKSQPLAKIIGGNSCYFPNRGAATKEYFTARHDFVTETIEENGIEPGQIGIVWHLDFWGNPGPEQDIFDMEALKGDGPPPQLINLTPHVGFSGGLAGALAAVIACAPGSQPPAFPKKNPQREIIISEDGLGSLAIIIMERLS
jgi:3-oxoacyl-[acyl-carrier-protein] synthase II